MINSFGEDICLPLVQLIYETVVSPPEWEKVIAELIDITKAAAGAVVGFKGAEDRRASVFAKGVPKASLCNPPMIAALHAATLTLGQGAFLTIDLKAKLNPQWDVPVRECFGAEGSLLILVLVKEGGRRIALVLHFDRGGRSETDRAAETLMKLLPHFQTAFAIQKTTLLEREKSAHMESAFFSSSAPSAIITEDYQVRLANGSFEKFVEASHLLVEYSDSVIDFVDTALQDEVARLIGMAASHGRVRHVAWVEDKVKNIKWLVSVDALSGRVGLGSQFKNVFATNERVYMLTIRELGGNSLLAPDTIKSIFGLTPTEADLAHCLLRGETASEIARQRGVSKNTVHNQLASAMARVGVNRQTQFLHCLSMLSAMC